MIGFPLDSHVTYDTDGIPAYDRAITSAPLRKLIKNMFSDGVLPNPSTNMQVAAGTGMNVIVYPGFACCNGCMKLEESQRTLAVQASNTAYDRIDTVVLRLNDNDSERICDFYILEGTPATSPVRPTLTRSESVWELGLADLFIAKNSTALSNQRITDTRYETARCGIMSSISRFDTTTLYNQIRADLENFQNVSQADFTDWFEDIKGQLSEDPAGNLQNQIGLLLSLETAVKTSVVDAINWLKEKQDGLSSKIEDVEDDLSNNIEDIKNELDGKSGGFFVFPVCSYTYDGNKNNVIIATFPPYMMSKYTITCTSVNIIGEGAKSITSQSIRANGIEILCQDVADFGGHFARCTFSFTVK